MNKLVVLALVGLLLVSCVSAIAIKYSNSSVGFPEPTLKPETHECSNEEWNGFFEDYRGGLVSRKDTIKLLRGCDRW